MAEAAPVIFLSYKQEETPFVSAVADVLRSQHVPTRDTADLRIAAGTRWVDPVAEALAGSDVVVVFIGAATGSPWQNFGIGAALGARKHVVPVYVTEGAIATAPPPPLWMFQSIDAHDLTPQQVADQIIRAIGVAA